MLGTSPDWNRKSLYFILRLSRESVLSACCSSLTGGRSYLCHHRTKIMCVLDNLKMKILGARDKQMQNFKTSKTNKHQRKTKQNKILGLGVAIHQEIIKCLLSFITLVFWRPLIEIWIIISPIFLTAPLYHSLLNIQSHLFLYLWLPMRTVLSIHCFCGLTSTCDDLADLPRDRKSHSVWQSTVFIRLNC